MNLLMPGLAAEKAKKTGLKVEMVIVGDDIALPDNKQPRGIAGTVMVHKIAGHAAEQELPLSEVFEAAKQACASIFSIGVARQTCHLPDSSSSEEDRIKSGQVELGLGNHRCNHRLKLGLVDSEVADTFC